MIRHYDVSAIQIPIVYNKYADVDPDGLMYVLKENESKVQRMVRKCPGTYVNLVQPLVIRVNQYDILEITFTNRLCFSTGINVKGLQCEIQDSDGAFAGENESSLAAPDETVVYRWEATLQGGYQISDLGNPLGSELGSNIHGLFGAVIVEPPGSYWTDMETGEELNSGVFADVHHPFLPDFREYVTIFHDEAPVKNRCLETPFDPHAHAEGMTHSINYRSEPMRNKLHLIEEGIVCPECEGEEVHHDSWVFGDPAPTILPRSYVGDPIHWYVVGGGMKETHIFHLHLQQWNDDTQNPGWNYFTGAAHNQTIIARWYADAEVRACFMHDYLFANSVQLHGLFGAMIIEPEGSKFLDSHTGKKTKAGSQIIVQHPILPDFREFNLEVADFIPAFDRKGRPLNPPERQA